MLTVDSHVHAVAADRTRYPLTPVDGRLGEWVDAKPTTTEDLVGDMDTAGVERAIFIQAATAYGFENDYTVDSVKRHPGRFVGVCMVDVLHPDAPQRLSQLVEREGMRGVRLFTTPDPEAPWLDDLRTFPVWERALSLGIPLIIQMHTRHLSRLRAVLERFPAVPVILDHLANAQLEQSPAPAADLVALADLPNVYAKFTTVNLYAVERAGTTAAAFFKPLLERFGARRILWGSNYPNTYDRPYGAMLELAREAFVSLSVRDQEMLFGGTAVSIWPDLLTE